MSGLLAVGDVAGDRVDEPGWRGRRVACDSTQRTSPSGRTTRTRNGLARRRRRGEHVGELRARSRSRSSGCDELPVRAARRSSVLGEAEQRRAPPGWRRRIARRAPSRPARRATSSKSRCSRVDVLVGAHPRPPVEGSPDAHDSATPPEAQGTARRRTACMRQTSGQIAPMATGCAAVLLCPPEEVIRLGPPNPRAVAWRLTRLRSLRQQRAGRSRELHRGGPGHRSRRARRARAVPVAPPARPARGVRWPRSSTHVGVYLRLEQARFPGRIEVELPAADDAALDARRRGRRPGARWARRSAAGWRSTPGRCAWPCARRDGRARPAARPPRRARRGRRAPADPVGPGAGGEGAHELRPGDPRRRRRAARAGRHQAPARDLGLRRARGHGHVGQGGARLPLRRPLRRALPRRRACPRSRAWRSRACCGASPTRRRSSSSPATPTPPSRRSRSRRSTSSSSPSRASASSPRSGASSSTCAAPRRPRPRPSGDGAAAPRPPAPTSSRVDNPKGGGKRLVRLETISFAQANGDYARIVCEDGRFLLRTPLSQLEKDWARDGLRARAPRVPRQPQARGRAARAAQRHRRAHHARRHRDPGRAPQRRRAAAPAARLAGGCAAPRSAQRSATRNRRHTWSVATAATLDELLEPPARRSARTARSCSTSTGCWRRSCATPTTRTCPSRRACRSSPWPSATAWWRACRGAGRRPRGGSSRWARSPTSATTAPRCCAGAATEVELDPEVASWSPRMDEWAREAWNDELHRLRVRAEDKDVIRAYHWRGAPDEAAAEAAVRELAERAEADGLVVHWGRKVLEVRPPVALNKGRGVEHLLDGTDITAAVYVGDDNTDLDAFEALRRLVAEGRLRGRRLRRRRLRRDARRARGPGRRARRRPGRRAHAAVRIGRVAAGALRRPAQDDGHAQRRRGDDARDRHRHRRHAATATTRSCCIGAGWWVAASIIGAAARAPRRRSRRRSAGCWPTPRWRRCCPSTARPR